MTTLVRYDAACKAIAAAKSVDEVKGIRDKAEALRLYAHQAKNKNLEVDAAEIRFRAERRVGEMIAEQRETVGLSGGGRPRQKTGSAPDPVSRATLADAGIDKHLADRARRLAAVPSDEFETTVATWRNDVSRAREKVTTDLLKAGDKASRRAEREADLGARQMALPNKRYGVILADPPWRFEPYSRETGMDRAADNHYPTTATGNIAAWPIPSIAADDCILFLWSTAPMIEDAFAVMLEWGFNYKTQAVWIKDRIGTGYWFRNKHEILLVGTRGKIPAPAPGTQWPSAVEAPVGEHSAKPTIFLEMIETYFPTLPKIELNRRGALREGWDAWGNEVTP